MSALLDIYLKKDTLKTLLDVLEKKQEQGLSLTISVNNETGKYGQNVASWVTQTKEQREAKKERFFTGNGKVFWTDGVIKLAEKQDAAPTSAGVEQMQGDDDLPF
jgi:hypothetical protein